MKYYSAHKMKGRGFDCIGCKESKCLLRGPVEIETHERDEYGQRIKMMIANKEAMLDYVSKAIPAAQGKGLDPTEFDLVWTASGHRVCPMPLIDMETLHLYQAVNMAGKPDPRDVLKLPAYFVQVKGLIDLETNRMERLYAG